MIQKLLLLFLALIGVASLTINLKADPASTQLPEELIANLSSEDLGKRLAARTELLKLAAKASAPGGDPAAQAAFEERLISLAVDGATPETARVDILQQLKFLFQGV